MLKQLPDLGVVFWPVGTGDSTTICIDEDTVIQVDLHHLANSEDDDDGRTPIIDRLVELLPKKNSKPYLAVFVLTHPDQDHCRGFQELRKRITIGEIWFAPRVFREHNDDLCDDAVDFRKEAKRRVKATIDAGGDAGAGDRVRVVGYSDLLKEEDFNGFPKERLHAPGDTITIVDDTDMSDTFSAFIHAPFKDDDVASERNETSIGMRIELKSGELIGRVMLLGDLSYPTVRRVFDESRKHKNEDKLVWDAFLSPHQCSKSVMYWADEGEEEPTLRKDILEDIEKAADGRGYIIASSDPIPTTNKKGDNPPHAKAKARYQEIAPNDFICTGEHPDADSPEPIVFELSDDGLTLVDSESESDAGDTKKSRSAFAEALGASAGATTPPTRPVGFGRA
jgi:beta-lactamase superfamily II metal-dependent hydrolase